MRLSHSNAGFPATFPSDPHRKTNYFPHAINWKRIEQKVNRMVEKSISWPTLTARDWERSSISSFIFYTFYIISLSFFFVWRGVLLYCLQVITFVLYSMSRVYVSYSFWLRRSGELGYCVYSLWSLVCIHRCVDGTGGRHSVAFLFRSW